MEGWIMGDIRTTTLGGIPFGNNAGRPSSPSTGQPYFNGESQRLELYTGSQYGWQNIVAETPGVTGYTGTIIETSLTNTITILGTNFALGAVATLVGTDGTEYAATVTTVNNLTNITATFGQIPANKEPYDIRITNPSNLYGVYYDIVTVNDKPVWQTPAGSLGTFNELSSISVTVSATDEENNAVTYSSSNLPAWLSLNSSSGVISGTTPTVSSNTTYSFNILASDGINDPTSRAFTITVNDTVFTAEVLLIAGGGGGGSQVGGGGGAGGLIYSSSYAMNKSSTYSVSIGSGGVGGPWQGSGTSRPGSYGGNSTFGSWTALGGGGGGGHGSNFPASGNDGIATQSGRPGGSGGGGGANDSNGVAGSATQTSPSGGTGYGFSGGTGYVSNWAGGGGGGAGGVGVNSTPNNGGAGGPGRQYSITGTSLFYAAGGGGCGNGNADTGALGGSGIGGNGKGNTNNTNTKLTTDGAANTGSGGGGARDTGPGGDGGSGVLIIAYPDTISPITIGSGLTYDQPTRAGYRVYRITGGSGNIIT